MTESVDVLAVIGTREPDAEQVHVAASLVESFTVAPWSLVTTGAAYGIDKVAMDHAQPWHLHVFLPWSDYNRAIIPKHAICTVYDRVEHKEWTESVHKYHPAALRLSRGAFALHARNYGIVVRSRMVLAFPNERGEGGTGQGIRIARALGIPVLQFNKGCIFDVDACIRDAWEKISGKVA